MGVLIDGGVSGSLVEVGVGASVAAQAQIKPIAIPADRPDMRHYRLAGRTVLLNAQGSNSRIVELRNSKSDVLILPTQFRIQWTQTGNHTAAIRQSLNLYKIPLQSTSTANVATTVTIPKRSKTPSQLSTAADIKVLAAAGNTSGITGSVGDEVTELLGSVELWLLLTQPTTTPVPYVQADLLKGVCRTHPVVLRRNEALLLRTDVVMGATAGSAIIYDFSWAETRAY